MGRGKRSIEEMSDEIYLAVTYHVPVPIMARFLLSLKRKWNHFIVPETWINGIQKETLNKAGIDLDTKPCREYFGRKYYKLYKI